jgi:ACS family 4-hydroxyphenylacetate permease-like MFS transporter
MTISQPLAVRPRTDTADAADAVVRKVFRRLMWFLFVLLVVAFVDRINIGFAALTMNKDLGLSAAAFGLSITVFYTGYALCEIPSNLALARFGARVWIARIMITWGIASAATAFAVGMWSLYGLRLLVGIAEAGFQPGMFLYITYWFPQAYRARANAVFIMGAPVTIAIASTLSGFILGMDGFLGLAGWRWLFLLEGLPAVVLGVVCFFYLADGPAEARWLTAAEKALLQARLERDRARVEAAASGISVLRQLAGRDVVMLSIAYFGLISSLNTNGTWTPLIIREIAPGASFVAVGLLTAIPALLSVAAMLFWSHSSDRREERAWHIRIGLLIAVVGWVIVAAAGVPQLRFCGLILASAGSFCALSTFWTLCGSILSRAAGPAGMALINCVGIAGGSAVTPSVVGILKDWSGSFAPGILFVVLTVVLAIVLVSVVAAQQREAAEAVSPGGV